MAEALVFVSGGSSGIGLAVARAVPYADARVVDISRRGTAGIEHFAADLADPASWPAVAALFEKELAGFGGSRCVFVHSAGTLSPIGFAGEVDAAAYTRQVLLDAAAPLVLGDAFLRAVHGRAGCTLLMISSGAARKPYAGWSGYCAGKAAVDHWVRTVGVEQARRGGCRVLSVAPGVVATAMQEEIRATAGDDFPDVARFQAMQREGALRDPAQVARELWDRIESDVPGGSVLDLRDV